MEETPGTKPVGDPPIATPAGSQHGNGDQPQVADSTPIKIGWEAASKAGQAPVNSSDWPTEAPLLNGCHNGEDDAEAETEGHSATGNDLAGAVDALRLNDDYAGSRSVDSSGVPAGSETHKTVDSDQADERQDSEQAEESPLPADHGISYVGYESELQMPGIMKLITRDLSEPYSIYTYRYFIHNWPELCFLAMDEDDCVGAIVCKLDIHKKVTKRGYIAMLAVNSNYRRKGIGSGLVRRTIDAMISNGCDEVVLEAEVTNTAALSLYENLGFVRDKRLFRYYLNGVDAFRLKLWLA